MGTPRPSKDKPQADRAFPESRFLEILFREFEKKGIPYAVLRNFDMLPHTTRGSDLDVWIFSSFETQAMDSIYDAVAKAQGTIIGGFRSPHFLKLFAYGKASFSPEGWWGLPLDVFFEMKCLGTLLLLDPMQLLARVSFNEKRIKILPPRVAAVLGVLKEMLHNDVAPQQYLKPAREIPAGDWDEIRMWLAPLGDQGISLLRSAIQDTRSEMDVKAVARRLRRHLLWRAFRRSPLQYVLNRSRVLFSKVLRMIRPPGMVLAVLGVDGAGKSTLIQAIQPVLSDATHRAFFVKHLRPGLLPPLARFRGIRHEQQGPVTDPHASTASGFLGSMIRILYLLADYLLGYWLLVRPKIAKQPAIFVFDRYAYDMTLDPRRFRIGLSPKVFKRLVRLVPKPDLIFCLQAPPEVIASRKSELPAEEIERQLAAIKEFAQEEPRAVLISTEGRIDEIRDRVLEELFRFCKRRAKRLFPRS